MQESSECVGGFGVWIIARVVSLSQFRYMATPKHRTGRWFMKYAQAFMQEMLAETVKNMEAKQWMVAQLQTFYKQVCIYIHNAGARQNEPPSMPHNWVPYHPTIYHYIFRIIWWPQIVVIMLIFDTRQSLSTFDLSSKVGVQILELSLGTRKMRPSG